MIGDERSHGRQIATHDVDALARGRDVEQGIRVLTGDRLIAHERRSIALS
jgi:hypothetical protein